MKKHILIIKTFILLIILSTSTFMNGQCVGDNTFSGTTDNDWSTAANWSEGCVPGGGTITGVITIAADCEVSDALNYTFGSGATLKIADGITFTNNGTGVWWIEGVSGTGTYEGDLTINGTLKPGYTAWSCGDPLDYEGQSYATVEIGGQCWMAENLNVGTMINGSTDMTNNGTIEKYCYDDDPTNCATYGGLYKWDEMMQYVTIESTQGICPSGWHLPSDDEFKTLEMALGMTQAQADGLNYRGTDQGSQLAGNEPLWTDGALDVNGTGNPPFGTSGFDLLPGGLYNYDNTFKYSNNLAFLYSSSEVIGIKVWIRGLRYTNTGVFRSDYLKNFGSSVRCVKD